MIIVLGKTTIKVSIQVYMIVATLFLLALNEDSKNYYDAGNPLVNYDI